MKLTLANLQSMHPVLRGYPIDLFRFAALALQRADHESPARTEIDHDDERSTADIEWLFQNLPAFEILDQNRITEDGAEAVALAYVHCQAGWTVKRRLQRGESADWLLRNEKSAMALEISGMAEGDRFRRLEQKREQVARCSLPVEKLAIVVAFDGPFILARSV